MKRQSVLALTVLFVALSFFARECPRGADG